MLDEMVTLRLPRNYAGQMLDGIRCREEAYRQTAEYLERGHVADPAFVCEEVSDADEARNLADTYAEIIELVNRQLGE